MGVGGSTFQKSGKFHELSRKSIKKITPPPTKGGRSGNFRGSKNQKSGKCHELSRKSINLFLPNPPWGGFQSRGGGGGWGSTFQKSGKFHELSRKSIKKITPPPPKGVEVGILGGQKIKSPGNVMNCPENQYNLFLPIPPWGGSRGGSRGGWGSKFQKFGKFHELLRKSITIFLPPPPPTKGGRSGNFRGSKKSGKCHELPRKVI